ncbi:MAG: 30S ribosomal protein S12 methylthiotransferase RimO [Treponema sp.]|nr:30S ribosomal protein S12 methylthiotransferase RimO [Treponema sp.]MCL2250450.1 30S ribosomal protein S12 methylthiotransferase RimO [Treponema sp.]
MINNKKQKRYFLDPFGCVKNQVDAENMMALLNKEGWENAADAETAELIIINSCGFIESAKQESINAVLEWRKTYPDKKIILAGCLSQRYAKELAESLTEADACMGTDDISQITELANFVCANKVCTNKVCTSSFSANPIREYSAECKQKADLPFAERPLLSLPGSAYIKISEGCSNCCSYCAIPLIRGKLVSRSIPGIIDECKALLKRGIVELCIIGQDIGAFGTDNKEQANFVCATKSESLLPELLNEISKLKGDFWVRLLYIHPDHFPLQILDIMERDKRILPYFDIPFQHASAKILAAMNRKGKADKYLALLETIRTRLPNAVIRSTFLLGFPGETEEDFAALLDFQQKANLDWLGCFTFSREEGTAAYPMKRRVPAKTAVTRKQLIEERQTPITEKNMERFAGLTLDILIEEKIDAAEEEGESFRLGRLYCQAPDIDGATVIVSDEKNDEKLRAGAFVKCQITARRGFDLEAIF